MADLYGNASDGIVYSSTESVWANARDDSSGIVTATSDSANTAFTAESQFSRNGGGSTYRLSRSFILFDHSGLTGKGRAATIKVDGISANEGKVIIGK